ncbi:type I-E CRISPR-associated protein Cse1/CasA [Limnochorda pilosa]|uniref:CRISPR-associated protein Cse1 n=1 Tax=Limnochorda pilosa TaxID=1555112 RepID=A0A0K2SKE5_LIMPI|nr:type I-E CRISPR-associated protein Cse1/CasA [Limnochorda pilosa]BAS27309.1 CRISPR-associated protein Cse1 [Limnochorda pilosa]
MATFNLIDEPWIPAVDQQGAAREVGLREALVDAHLLSSVRHASPLATVALHRLMLAVLHRIFGPRDPGEWVELWRQGQWDGAALQDYLDHWRDRFDLFDPVHPFYQVPQMPDAVTHPPEHLMLEAASGNNATLFDHHHERRRVPLRAADAACYLLAQQSYAIGFGKSSPFYFSDAPLVRGFTVLIHGETLFETLMLNLQNYTPTSRDLPAWEDDAPREPDRDGTLPRGYLDYLTWQSRRIHLIADGDPPYVIGCQIQQNLKLRGDESDPFKVYRSDKERGMVPLSLVPGRAVWRNADALFHLPEATRMGPQDQSTTPPRSFRWLSVVRQQARGSTVELRSVYRFGVYGMATQPGKAASVVLWAQEELPLPLDLLDDAQQVHDLADGLGLAERAGSIERRAVQHLASLLLTPESDLQDGRRADPKAIHSLAEHMDPTPDYWAALGGTFGRFMVGLTVDRVPALQEWADAVRIASIDSFGRLVRSLGTSARELKAIVRAERAFRLWLNSEVSEWKERVGYESAQPA